MAQAKYTVTLVDGQKKTVVLNLDHPLHYYSEVELKAEIEQQTDFEILRDDVRYVSEKSENEY